MPAKTVAIVQARMSSRRLPGKVLLPIAGRPAILFMCERLKRSQLLDTICVATSGDPSDDELAAVAAQAGLAVFRGSLDDVLDRFTRAAREHGADIVVRLTGDCPIIDPGLIDRLIEMRAARNLDYASNGDPATYPDGLDAEVMTMAALHQTCIEATAPSEREHVTLHLRTAPQFSRGNLAGAVDLSNLRWTVDYPDDLEFVRMLVNHVPDPVAADMFDFLRVQERLGARKQSHDRNEGLAISLAAERNGFRVDAGR